MTEPTTDPNVLDFTSDVNRKLTDNDRVNFRLDGDEYTLLRPKTGAMMSMAVATTALRRIDFNTDLSIDDMQSAGAAVNALLINIAEPGQSKLRRRLDDPTDGLDVLDMLPIVTKVVGVLSVRPTTAQPESS